MDQTIAVVFPGQGSQSVGMLSQLAAKTPLIEETFAEASATLGYDLWAFVQQGPLEKLSQTTYTQPALLTASVALWRLYCLPANALKPAFLAGHSLGEYAALVCANALSFEDGLRLVALRGALMQTASAPHQGGMAAILGLEQTIVEDLCQRISALNPNQLVVAANYNTPEQIVISGHAEAVLAATAEAKRLGAKRCVPLEVSVAAHSPLMQPVTTELAQALQSITFKTPTIPVIHNADCLEHYSEEAIRSALVAQLCRPVQWVKIVRLIAKAGVSTFYECGPGSVLCHLNKRIVPELHCYGLSNRETLDVV